MRLRVSARGTASMSAMWEAYADPERWHRWAPHIRSVDTSEPLREGLGGTVTGLLGVPARFLVTRVEADAGRWSWQVHAGPATLRIDHEVADGRASIAIEGPAWSVLAYAPVARVALSRLVGLDGSREGA